MEVGVKVRAHVLLLAERCAVLSISFLRLLLCLPAEQPDTPADVYGEFVLIMGGHGLIILHHIVLTQQWIGRGVLIWASAVRVQELLIVHAVRQPVLVATNHGSEYIQSI